LSNAVAAAACYCWLLRESANRKDSPPEFMKTMLKYG
jgi:hypothetical protein